MSDFIETLKVNGYAKITSVFNDQEKKKLHEYSTNILNEEIINYKDVPSTLINNDVEKYYNDKNIYTFFKTLNRNFIGHNEELDQLFSNLFSKKEIKNYLKRILGEDYKLSTCMLRKADNNSDYMGLHCDNNFAFTMSILCNDIGENHPTTVFIPSSHKFNYNFRNEIERLNPEYFSYLTKSSLGEIGDINCFFNKTIHGIKKSSKKKKFSNIIWLLGFHRNSEKKQRTLLLPEYSNYGKKMVDIFSNDALNLFELKKDSRVFKNNINGDCLIDNINKKNRYSLKQIIMLNFLKFVSLNIKLIRKILYFKSYWKT